MSSPSEDEDRDLHLRAIEVVKALDGLKINSALRVLDHTAKALQLRRVFVEHAESGPQLIGGGVGRLSSRLRRGVLPNHA